ncbi:hypothetical protein B0T18DRAFT_395740 [Schizothecium vesticola]|uniref:Uncharacterized protein n=1 Tax=Schizothecium vesticola TaxID=314040 RepID=A0AA40F849_9PEZI|nr:hypothetical protein B0T18DRAFT_395740 [Schizothecium vesticola]
MRTPDEMSNVSHASNSASVKRKPVPDSETQSNRRNEDVDKTTTHSPVIQERITPQVHEIQHQQIHREIHTHDVIHTIQPIRQIEVLPAKHYVQDANGKLVEISKRDLSDKKKA